MDLWAIVAAIFTIFGGIALRFLGRITKAVELFQEALADKVMSKEELEEIFSALKGK